MPTFIEIENDVARVVERTIISQSSLASLLPNLERRVPVATPLLPKNTVLAFWDESSPALKTLKVVCEVDPRVRTITYNSRSYRVAVPYIYFVFWASHNQGAADTEWSLDDYRVYARPRPLTGWSDPLWRAPLPNLFNDDRICFGSTAPNAAQTIANRLQHIINEFWVTPFNSDLGTNLPRGFDNFRTWERASTESNDFTSWEHFDSGYSRGTVASILDVEYASRTVPVSLDNSIPEIPIRPTFGSAAEWLLGLTDVQRSRLIRAMEIVQTENPIDADAVLEEVDEEEDDE